MDIKTKALGVLTGVTLMASNVLGAYTPSYTTTDVAPSIIDFLVTLVVGLVGEADTIGIAVALTISVGLLIGLVLLIFRGLKGILKNAKGMK